LRSDTAVLTGGPPVAAAVALRNIEILQEEKLANRAAAIGAYLLDALQSLKSHKNVGDIHAARGC
jgi:taurine-pyruvate aminotransferase